MRQARDLRRHIRVRAGELEQTTLQATSQALHALAEILHFPASDFKGLAHPHNAGHVQRTRAAPVFVAAAVQKRREADAGVPTADIQGPRALRAVELVRRADKQVRQRGMNGNLARRLGGVRHEQYAPGAGYFRKALHGLDDARLVVRPHHGNEYRVVAQGVFQRARIDASAAVHRQVGDFVALSLQGAMGAEDGLMLGLRGNKVPSPGPIRLRYALDGRIGSFGSAGGEHDLPRLRAQGGGHLLPGLFARFLRRPAQRMALARRIAVLLAKPGQHSPQDPFVYGRGRIVIEVNDAFHSHPCGARAKRLLRG